MSIESVTAEPAARRRRAAFTLLEVLAAVAILGIWYTVIATGALRGLRSEGENLRHLRASLVADEQLAEIESAVLLGSPLELIEDEIEEEDFTIRVAVSEFVAEGEEPQEGLAGLIASEQEGSLVFLRAVRVEVAWQEGNEERSIQRETFAFDRSAWKEFVESKGEGLFGAEGGGEEDDGALEEDELEEELEEDADLEEEP